MYIAICLTQKDYKLRLFPWSHVYHKLQRGSVSGPSDRGAFTFNDKNMEATQSHQSQQNSQQNSNTTPKNQTNDDGRIKMPESPQQTPKQQQQQQQQQYESPESRELQEQLSPESNSVIKNKTNAEQLSLYVDSSSQQLPENEE